MLLLPAVVSTPAHGTWQCTVAPEGGWSCSEKQAPSRSAVPAATVKPGTAAPAAPTPKPAATPVAAAPSPAELASARAEQRLASGIAPQLDENLDWLACRYDGTPPAAPDTADKPIEIGADSIEADPQSDTALFTGNVVIRQGDQYLYGSRISLDRNAQQASSLEPILIDTPQIRILGASAQYQIDQGTGSIQQAEYRLPWYPGRGHADHASLVGAGNAEFDQVSFTTCPPDNNGFEIAADHLLIDQETGTGTAEAATLEFKGLPILYLPKLTFPLRPERKSGFLLPQVGYGSNTGLDLAVPYYLNLAPNYDATLIPRLLSKRGLALAGEFRYLLPGYSGTLAAEVLPNDREYDDGVRGAVRLNNSAQFARGFSGHLLVNYVSDDQYLEDLGGSLAVASTRHLEQSARLDYRTEHWDLMGRVQHFQTLDQLLKETSRPYSRLPQVVFNMPGLDLPYGPRLLLNGEYVNFDRSSGVTGQRLDLEPGISLPLRASWGFVEPKVTGRYTSYQLDGNASGTDDSPDRTLYTASIDSGLLFDRSTSWFGHAMTQTLEPRLFYLYVPYEDQDDLPLFDTSELDFNFDNLFRTNRYAGRDRVGDANQLTLALSSAYLSDVDGSELFRASLGQIYYFEDRKVGVPGAPPDTDSSSSFLAQVQGRMAGNLFYRAGLQYDPHLDDEQVRQSFAQISYQGDDRRYFGAGYRLREGVIEQTDLSMLLPLSRDLAFIGRWNYSLFSSQTLEALLGIEYGDCCWRLRAIARHYLSDETGDYDTGVMLQLELRGLARIGKNIDSYLEQSLWNYQADTP